MKDEHRHKPDRPKVYIDPKINERLIRYTKKTKLSKKFLTEHALDILIRYDVVGPGGESRLKQAIATADNMFAGLDPENVCIALSWGVENGTGVFSCLWGRKGNTPMIKKLGSTFELASNRCARCKRTLSVLDTVEELEEEVLTLEHKVEGYAKPQRMKIPKCNRGAVLHEDKESGELVFHNCHRHPGEPVSIAHFCKVQQRGLPCYMYAEIVVAVKKDL